MLEIEKMLMLNYEECCNYLKEKYGLITKNYFTNETCKNQTSSIKRTKEGLYIHHIDEDKAIMLSTREYALKNPFSYQYGERLVYCNLLEHLVLHIKIIQYPNKEKNPIENVGVGGVFSFIIPELNDFYSGIKFKLEWKNKVLEVVKNHKKEYFMCLEFLFKNFDFPLQLYLKSFNAYFLSEWSEENNKELYKEISDLYSKCLNAKQLQK